MAQPLKKEERIAQTHAFKRQAVLEAARRVVARDGADGLTVRAVAAEAGYTPGSVYSYFDTRDELAIELLAQDLSHLAKRLKSARDPSTVLLTMISALQDKNAFAPYASAVMNTQANDPGGEAGRLMTGRLIHCLKILSDAITDTSRDTDDADKDTIVLTAMGIGLATLEKSGRLDMLGQSQEALVKHAVGKLLSSS